MDIFCFNVGGHGSALSDCRMMHSTGIGNTTRKRVLRVRFNGDVLGKKKVSTTNFADRIPQAESVSATRSIGCPLGVSISRAEA